MDLKQLVEHHSSQRDNQLHNSERLGTFQNDVLHSRTFVLGFFFDKCGIIMDILMRMMRKIGG